MKEKKFAMNPKSCEPGQIAVAFDPCCTTPEPESTATTLKRLRREAKRIRKQIAAVKKQAKLNAKAEAAALAKAKQGREDHERALKTFRALSDPGRHDIPARDRILAAQYLVQNNYGG